MKTIQYMRVLGLSSHPIPILFLKLYLTAYMQLLKVAIYLYKEKRVLPLTKK